MAKVYDDPVDLTPLMVNQIIQDDELRMIRFFKPCDEDFWASFNKLILQERKDISIWFQSNTKFVWNNFDFLVKLTNLENLNIVRAEISDLTPFAKLSNLKLLSIGNNHSEAMQLHPLQSLKSLESLYLSGNINGYETINSLPKLSKLGISSYSPDLNLTHFYDALLNLQNLQLNGELIKNLHLLAEAKKIKYLYLSSIENASIDLAFISKMLSLTLLELRYIEELEFLPSFAECRNLGRVVLEGVEKLKNLDNLKNAQNLEEFAIYEYDSNQFSIEDFEVLTQLPKLKVAYIDFVNDYQMRDELHKLLEKKGLITQDSVSEKFVKIRS